MTSRERILAALAGEVADHVPLTTWCFGFAAPPGLGWTDPAGEPVKYWYTQRLDHLHTLPRPWSLEDDFRRVKAWLSLGVDDALEVSVPWSCDPEVSYRDSTLAPGAAGGDARYPVMVREYRTPSGPLRHAVRRTGAEPEGWPVQPECVPLFEDYNIPRAVRHIVSGPADVAAIAHVYRGPDAAQEAAFHERMTQVAKFAIREGVFVQAWTAFGMDAVVWLAGTEGAILLAMDAPEAFGRLVETIAVADRARTELAARHPAVDMVVQRGWYSSTEFWSPALFERFVFPQVRDLAAVAHRHGKRFGYVMTTGVETLGPRLADAGVDLLFFVDPLQDKLAPTRARDLLGERMTLVGGANAVSLAGGDRERIRREVRTAVEALAPTRRFILHPVDAIFPDTPWAGVEALIEAWRECR